MKKLTLLLLLMISTSSIAQQVHSFYYLKVPRSQASDFIQLHKTYTDIYLMGSEENKWTSTWLFTHTYGSDFTFQVIETFPDVVAQASAVNPKDEVFKNIDAMDATDEEKENLKKGWGKYLRLFIEDHSDEVRVAFNDDFYITDKGIDFTKKHTVVFSKFNPSWWDRSSFMTLWREISRQPAIDQGYVKAIVPTGHYSGSSYTFQTALWYKSLKDLAKDHDANASGEMSNKEKEMWDLARSHTDEVLTYVGSNWEAVSKPTKQFIIAE